MVMVIVWLHNRKSLTSTKNDARNIEQVLAAAPHPSRKLSKLEEPDDFRDTAWDAEMNS